LAGIDRALSLAAETGEHWTDSFLHRIRGEILLKRDPANTTPAADAFLTAIAIAQQQKARSFELRAALSLAKLYQSSGRAADAHAVLAPALEGFSPTPEFPEIAEAHTLLAGLAQTDEVKNATAARERRLKLQTGYGLAMMWSKGFGAEETKAAFSRASELAVGAAAAERFPANYGLWIGRLLRGELASAHETAEIFLREANTEGRKTEEAVAGRILGMTRLWQGNFVEARAHLENSLKVYNPERDGEAKFLFGWDIGAGASAIIALTYWLLGEVDRARERMEEAVARAVESTHEPTLANTFFLKALLEMLRGDPRATRRAAETVVELGRKLELALMVAEGAVCSAWVRARLGDSGTAELRQAIAAYSGQGNRAYMPLFQGELAALEAEREGAEEALALIDEALMLASETGEHLSDAFLHRLRGEILLKRDSASAAPAEEAFRTSLAIARQQKARSFELRAAMSMARLWRDQGKREEARELLAPVYGWFTEGFDTRDLKEAKALLEELAW
jgi:predicted ATPase